ncbi:MAG: sensor histidine kinase, partial [Chloroflexota bacterium]|nr:sensor histidine kinase [Chloroflexota bacterium]
WGPALGAGAVVPAMLATGTIALLFRPLHERLQRAADQLLHGAIEDPYAILSHLGHRLETVIDPAAVLPTIVETVADALKLPYVELALWHGAQLRVAAACGVLPSPAGDLLAFPLIYGNDTIGELRIGPRPLRDDLTPGDLALLANLARQAGAAAHAAQLTGELERSLQRIVNAREEARRRLGSDLHDGLGHRLAGLLRKAEAASNLLDDNPEVQKLMGELQGQARTAIDDVRALAHTLHPPELELLGLAGALRERTRDYHQGAGGERLQIAIDAPESLPALPAAVEAAAYYIAQEALTNVTRHAGARRCQLRLRITGLGEGAKVPGTGNEQPALEIEVSDDGHGLAPSGGTAGSSPGLGLTSMRERALELGGTCDIEASPAGGTRVFARLPYPPE